MRAGDQRFERSPRELVVAFDRLIRIGGGSERDEITRPGRLVELAAQYLGEIHLHEDQRRELVARAELELRLIAAREAVMAAVRAAAIRVQRPVEGHPLHGIQRRSAGDFLVARLVGATLRLVERRRRRARVTCSAMVLVVGVLAEIEERGVDGAVMGLSLYFRHDAPPGVDVKSDGAVRVSGSARRASAGRYGGCRDSTRARASRCSRGEIPPPLSRARASRTASRVSCDSSRPASRWVSAPDATPW